MSLLQYKLDNWMQKRTKCAAISTLTILRAINSLQSTQSTQLMGWLSIHIIVQFALDNRHQVTDNT